MLPANGEDRSGLGEPVAFEKQNAGGAEELIHRRGKRAAPANAGNEAPAEPGLDLSEDQGGAERGKGLEKEPGKKAEEGRRGPAISA